MQAVAAEVKLNLNTKLNNLYATREIRLIILARSSLFVLS